MTLTFSTSLPLHPLRFAPRLGRAQLHRPESPSTAVDVDTPNFTVTTSRGVVPHLSRDHVRRSAPIRWVHVPFESFLDHAPPVPTLLQTGEHPLHTLLGFPRQRHVLSMSLRDPADDREMPPNGNDYIAAYCVRGVRKVTRSAWRSYVHDCNPDVVVALSDTPFTLLPHSQKRLTKSIQRSFTWLVDMFRPITPAGSETRLHPNVLVHMAGGPSEAARAAFADSLMETLHDKDAEDCKPLTCLDDGLSGYLFDLAPLRSAVAINDGPSTQRLLPLIMASLKPLSSNKLRIVNTANSPHEMLTFILHIGIDLFDSHWAQEAAHRGIALDFRFPVPDQGHHTVQVERSDDAPQPPKKRARGLLDLGHNLYDTVYTQDFSTLATNFLSRSHDLTTENPICDCAACSPTAPAAYISHSAVDDQARILSTLDAAVRPFTRAYLHHLLHTHEMSAHTLLTLHNIQVLDAFFTGVRSLLASSPEEASRFSTEVEKFLAFYDEGSLLLAEATAAWKEVDMARGKGRLAREKAAEEVESTPTPELDVQQTALGQDVLSEQS